MINREIRDYIDECCSGAGTLPLYFEEPSYDNSIIGLDEDCMHIIYDYDKMVEEIMADDNISEEDAMDFIAVNTLRSLSYEMASHRPIIIYSIPEELRS